MKYKYMSHVAPFTTNCINSLAPRRCSNLILKHVLWIHILSTSFDIGLRGVPKSPINDKSTSVHVKAWCHQAISHYLSQCWPRPIYRHMISLSHNELTQQNQAQQNLIHVSHAIFYTIKPPGLCCVPYFCSIYPCSNMSGTICIIQCHLIYDYLYRYRDSQFQIKTVIKTFNLHNRNCHTSKTASLP